MAAKKNNRESKSSIDKSVDMDVSSRLEAINAKLKEKYDILPSVMGEDLTVKLYSTGNLCLDDALSGGLPVGRITEFYGEEQSGKSLISLLAIGQAQKAGKTCMLVDAEQAFNPAWAEKLGVDPSKLIILDNNVVEPIFDIIENYAKQKVVDLIVIDSIASLISNDELESELGAAKYASVALALSRVFRRVIPVLSANDVSLILINQVRDDLSGAYVKQVKTPGGRIIKHSASTRIKIDKAPNGKHIKEGDKVTGVETQCQVMKHRGGANFRVANFRIDYEKGLDKEYDLGVLLLSKEQIVQSGAWFTIPALGDQYKFQGFEKVLTALRTDEVLREKAFELAKKIISGDPNANDASTSESTKSE